MKLGFTGTQTGMSRVQKRQFRDFVRNNNIDEFHHGDCIGADAEAHNIVREEKPACMIHAHPCNIHRKRAHMRADVIHPVKPPLDRNKDIVDASDHLFASPKGPEERRSGTWSTVRYAEHQHLEHTIAERANGVH